jgi:hypothetical protein
LFGDGNVRIHVVDLRGVCYVNMETYFGDNMTSSVNINIRDGEASPPGFQINYRNDTPALI